MTVFFWLSIWWIFGMLGFAYWWTRDYPYRSASLALRFLTGLLGPFSFIFGWTLHND